MSDTKVVVIPKTADVQNVIQALSAKAKESGRSKFILLGGNAGQGSGPAPGEEEGSTGSSARQTADMTHHLSNKPVPAPRTRRCSGSNAGKSSIYSTDSVLCPP